MEKDVTHFESDCLLTGMISACPFRASNGQTGLLLGSLVQLILSSLYICLGFAPSTVIFFKLTEET